MSCQLRKIDGIRRKKHWYFSLYEGGIQVLHSLQSRLLRIKASLNDSQARQTDDIVGLEENRASIKAGSMVKVKEKTEILRMLNRDGKYKGCSFLRRMHEFCGKRYRVHKEVAYFYDEAKQRMCRCRNIVLLEDVLCSGKQKLYLDDCDRYCFYFWHKDWLKNNEQGN